MFHGAPLKVRVFFVGGELEFISTELWIIAAFLRGKFSAESSRVNQDFLWWKNILSIQIYWMEILTSLKNVQPRILRNIETSRVKKACKTSISNQTV